MPNVMNWKDIERERMNPLVTRQCIHTENMTVARVELAQGAVVPEHRHPNEQILTLQTGRLVCRMDGKEIVLTSGDMLPIAPNVPHEVEALENSVAVDIFSPRREDWLRGDDAYLRR